MDKKFPLLWLFRSSTFLGLTVAVMLIVVACGQTPKGRGRGEVETTSQKNQSQNPVSFSVETVVGGLEVPWSIVWAPDGRMIFTERPGRLRVFEKGKLQPQPLLVLSDVESTGETGLMSVALHRDFATNRLLYLSYAYKGAEQRVRVVRYRETPNGLIDRQVIIENIQHLIHCDVVKEQAALRIGASARSRSD